MPWPTGAAAQRSDMGSHAYAEFLYKALGLQHVDPVAHWQAVKMKQERLVGYLSDKSEAVVRGTGVDLTFSFVRLTWVSAHGELNLPDGEIYTGPIEDSVNGSIAFNMPSLTYGRGCQPTQYGRR